PCRCSTERRYSSKTRSSRRLAATASKSRRPFSRPRCRSFVRFSIQRLRFFVRGIPVGRRRLAPSLPRPVDLREPGGDVFRPPTHRVLQDERQREEENQAHEEAVPTVLRGTVRAGAPPAPRAARVRRLEGELQEAEPRDLATG